MLAGAFPKYLAMSCYFFSCLLVVAGINSVACSYMAFYYLWRLRSALNWTARALLPCSIKWLTVSPTLPFRHAPSPLAVGVCSRHGPLLYTAPWSLRYNIGLAFLFKALILNRDAQYISTIIFICINIGYLIGHFHFLHFYI